MFFRHHGRRRKTIQKHYKIFLCHFCHDNIVLDSNSTYICTEFSDSPTNRLYSINSLNNDLKITGYIRGHYIAWN